MKSIALVGIEHPETIIKVLSEAYPEQANPWVIKSQTGDPIAYLNFSGTGSDWPAPYIQADISGRHYNEDEIVRNELLKISEEIGGKIETDNESNQRGQLIGRSLRR